ncbi:hypothetical protein F503_04353 [Ophiostoma piceae UAMH 11346]|uniref:ER membrane protein complex subunit 7 beta-sandwich domain-containing protein n=1 Tax=Ophiostoma piceae (strain UAMH 11346) TaxID=1262450 RepID=S3CA27_OPHP1|nr:hypothetical protein F503_04353 [Ophiostoma piceae UAMH 11346]
MRSVSLLSLLFAAATAAVASVPTTSITFQIAIPEHLQQQQQGGQNLDIASIQKQFFANIPAWTRATLESGDAASGRHTYTSAPITGSGKLVFSNVTAGSYLGEVHCATHVFVPLRVDVDGVVGGIEGAGQVLTARATETYRGNDWANQGEALRKVAVDGTASSGPTFMVAPLTLATKSYYTARSTFDVLSLLKNPMILMALFAMVMMFGMPYLMDSMDPEMKAEFEARQKQPSMGSLLGGGAGGPGGAAPGAGFDMAAYLAGSGDKKQSGRK